MTRSRDELIVQLSDDVAKLAKPFNHSEQASGRNHQSRHASLLDQLEEELTDSTPSGEGGGSKQSPGSKPPIREEIAVLIWDAQRIAAHLVALAQGKPRKNTAENLQQLVGLMTTAEDQLVEHVCHQVGSLRAQIETQLTWELRPRRLAGSCPICAKKGGLVVQMDSYGPTSARCQSCKAEWDKTVLGLLASALMETPVSSSA